MSLVFGLDNIVLHPGLLKNYVFAVNKRDAQVRYSSQDLKTLDLYARYIRSSCYFAADSIFEKISQIEKEGPIFEAAQEIQRAIQPFVALCKDGIRRLNLAKTNPAEGPKGCHWLALYLNELNSAHFSKNREGMKAAIKNIEYFQGKIAEISVISERTKALSEFCKKRIDQLDFDRAKRDELYSWYGYLKSKTVDCYKGGLFYGFYGAGLLKTFLSGDRRWALGGTILGVSFPIFFSEVLAVVRHWNGIFFEKSEFSPIESFTSEEKEKLVRIQKDIESVASILGMPENISQTLQIIEEDDGIFVERNRFLRMSKEVFDGYDSEIAEKWKQLIDELPDDPSELGRFLDQASPQKYEEIQSLCVELMSENRLCLDSFRGIHRKTGLGVWAHELGHMQNYDAVIHGSAFGLLGILMHFIILCANPTNSSVGNAIIAAFSGFILSRVAPVRTLSEARLNQYCENKADAVAIISSEYNEGIISFVKSRLLMELCGFRRDCNVSCEKAVEGLLKSWDLGSTHPNSAKRLVAAIERRGRGFEPSSPFCIAARVACVAAIQLSLLGLEFYQIYAPIKELAGLGPIA